MSSYRTKYRGNFKPLNPDKYQGNVGSITYRSLWEFKFMRMLDNDPRIIYWSSEELAIPYISPVDGKSHRYFPDFIIKMNTSKGIKMLMVEIKPSNQCIRPVKRPKQKSFTYINEVKTYEINQAKWKAAKNYCDKNGWQFQVITEKTIKAFTQ